MLMLCSCSKIETTKPILNDITFTVQIDYNNTQYICNADVTNDALNLVILEPQEIKDLTLKIDRNVLTTKFKDIEYTPDKNTLPQGTVIWILYDVFNNVAVKECSFSDENCKISGKVDECEYEFVFSPSGLPLSLEIDDLDLKIIFNNVIVK